MRIISGQYGGRVIATSEGEGYRPATAKVRQAIFSMLEARGVQWDSCRVADIFAGSGSLALEVLSRGGDYALLVEKSKNAVAVLEINRKKLNISPQSMQIIQKDALSFLSQKAKKAFTLIFVDPPYGENLLLGTIERILKNEWLEEDGYLIAEVEEQLVVDDFAFAELDLVLERLYGQTRILLWKKK